MARGNSRAQSELGVNSVVGVDVFKHNPRQWGDQAEERYFKALSDDIALPSLRAENIRLREEYDRETEKLKENQAEIGRVGVRVHTEAIKDAAQAVAEETFGSKEYADIFAQTLGFKDAESMLAAPLVKNLQDVLPDKSRQRLADEYADKMVYLISKSVPNTLNAPATKRYEEVKKVKDLKTEAYYKVESARLAEMYQKEHKGPYVPEDNKTRKHTGAYPRDTDADRAGPMSLVLKWRAEGLSADRQRIKLYSELARSWDKETGRFQLPPARQSAIFNGLKRTIGKGSSDRMNEYLSKLTDGQRERFKRDLEVAQNTYGLLQD